MTMYDLHSLHDHSIQPPGANHMVYTPQDGVTSGGHFLSYSTLHLTELSLGYDSSTTDDNRSLRGLMATNASHPALLRYVVWMVLALPNMASDKSRTYMFQLRIFRLRIITDQQEHFEGGRCWRLSP